MARVDWPSPLPSHPFPADQQIQGSRKDPTRQRAQTHPVSFSDGHPPGVTAKTFGAVTVRVSMAPYALERRNATPLFTRRWPQRNHQSRRLHSAFVLLKGRSQWQLISGVQGSIST
jgi:hypothetical protein